MEIPWLLVILLPTLYILHKSFHKVTIVGFMASATIALTASYFIETHLHAGFIYALLITIALFPILELLFKKSFGGPKKQVYRYVPDETPEPDVVVEEIEEEPDFDLP